MKSCRWLLQVDLQERRAGYRYPRQAAEISPRDGTFAPFAGWLTAIHGGASGSLALVQIHRCASTPMRASGRRPTQTP